MKSEFAKDAVSNVTKTNLVRTLSEELFRVAFGHDENDLPIMVSKTTTSKNKINVECTDGTKFKIELNM